MNPFLIYVWGRVDSWQSIVSWMLIPSVVILTLVSIIMVMVTPNEWEATVKDGVKKIRLTTFILTCIFLPLKIIVPDSKTVATMIILPSVLESKVIQKDLPDVYDIALKNLKAQFTDEKAESK